MEAGKSYSRDKRSPLPKSEAVSKVMSSIKGSNTKPEQLLRTALVKVGLKGYRKNYKELPGKPDIVFTKNKLAIFVNGCYWHGCELCGWKPPKHNTEYWIAKINKNRARDQLKIQQLELLGYSVITAWEHDIKKNIEQLVTKISERLLL